MATLTAFPETAGATAHGDAVAPSLESRTATIHDGIRSIENRNWWTLFNTISILLLLTATIVCLTLPSVVQSSEPLADVNLDVAVRGLVGVVLIFNVYSIWQQTRLKKLCDGMKASLQAINGK
jgi:hypothetical protein